MQHRGGSPAGVSLDPFIGEWSMQAVFPGVLPSGSRGLTGFEWVADPALLVQRWEVPHPDAPDGIAIIRFDETTAPTGSTTSIPAASRAYTR
jgi:hypothetical protein